mmetsp:Transcript_27414/g.81981  ORF Transcript_27414/g.81981 Transcript_27414/m.81981 type:complete len:277 (-) Transcript_27414:399-1229(-)
MPPARIGRVGAGGPSPRDWLESLPPVTRIWFVAAFGSTCLVSFGLLDPRRILWSWPLVYQKFEVWRAATAYVFFGGFSFPFLINMYLLVQYSRNYEVSPYDTGGGGDTADYVWMLTLGAMMMCGLCTWLGVSAPAQGLTFYVLYVWSRRNPTTQVSLYGFPVQAIHLPWALLAFNLLIGNALTVPLMGVACGHAYYFAIDVVPDAYDVTIVKTPQLLCDACGGGGGAARSSGKVSRNRSESGWPRSFSLSRSAVTFFSKSAPRCCAASWTGWCGGL